jgi:hypothetical protein
MTRSPNGSLPLHDLAGSGPLVAETHSKAWHALTGAVAAIAVCGAVLPGFELVSPRTEVGARLRSAPAQLDSGQPSPDPYPGSGRYQGYYPRRRDRNF